MTYSKFITLVRVALLSVILVLPACSGAKPEPMQESKTPPVPAAESVLPNPGFETVDRQGQPVAWRSQGTGKATLDTLVHHGGARSVAVADAGDGLMSGWSTIVPASPDRTYRFAGWAKGGKLQANGFLPGGALQLEFLDAEDRPLGKPVVSATVATDQDWTELVTPPASTPAGTARVRLTAGIQYCNGTAWFDDLRLDSAQAAVVEKPVAKLKRHPKPDADRQYSTNLLPNADLEEADGEKPAQWTFVGSSAQDWTEQALKSFHFDGRPAWNLGRARGEWSRDQVYAGKGALLLESIDPPLSKHLQWYGRTAVDGYWLSDAMPCTAGADYLASAWICPGKTITNCDTGPLELRFFDAAGKQISGPSVRSGMSEAPAGVWSWWATRPWRAPEGAVQMRLRVGQELSADNGGWGRSRYDNLAVWKLNDAPAPPATPRDSARHIAWLRKVFVSSPPPYQAAPASAMPYESCWIRLENSVTGNCFRDPSAPVQLRLTLTNLLGESRTVQVRAVCTDWKGAEMPSVTLPAIALPGYGESTATLELPATKAYGAFHIDLNVTEESSPVGSGSGRFGELPALDRPRTAEAIWGITPLMDLTGDGRQEERALGELFRLAGFGVGWVRLYPSAIDPSAVTADTLKLRPLLQWYRSLGIRPVLQLMFPPKWRPLVREDYVRAGRAIAKASSDLVVAYGNHGIEQANSVSPYRGGGAARMTDEEYDTILSGFSEGLKAEAPNIPVLVGNIATDMDGKTLNRIYKSTPKGSFDGAILNAYMGVTVCILNSLKTLDAHGDTNGTVWQEETANQRSPYSGEARRYGEGQGASNLVRSWLEPTIKAGSRLKAFTLWGFRARGFGAEDDIAMVNPDLQPRPQFVAHAVMADALADAQLVADHSRGQLTCGEWKRGDGKLLIMWCNSGTEGVTLEAPRGTLTVMDVMGNRREVKASDGVAVLEVGTDPVYCLDGGDLAFSKRLEVTLGHGTRRADQPQAKLTVRNNQDAPTTVRLAVHGPLAGKAPADLDVPAHGQAAVDLPLRKDLDPNQRTPLSATVTTPSGAVFAANASLNIACAVRINESVPLNGRWDGPWRNAPVIPFGRNPDEVVSSYIPSESHTGTEDILGNLRMLWDEKNLYLGVEALDDTYIPQPLRNANGFMGDSIEFAIQPDGILSNIAPRHEFELYRPGKDLLPCLNRRFPSTQNDLHGWSMSVTPSGHRGEVNYQIAIPWSEIGINPAPKTGKIFTMGVVLNDIDTDKLFSGGRGHILWFRGVDNKQMEGFGDVVLVEPAAKPGQASEVKAADTPASSNLMVNPDFEQVDAGLPTNWIVGAQNNGAVVKVDGHNPHSGRNTLLLSQPKPLVLPDGFADAPVLAQFLNEKQARGYALISQVVPVESGKRYHFRFWQRSQGLVRESADDPKRGYAVFQAIVYWMKGPTEALTGKGSSFPLVKVQAGLPDWSQTADHEWYPGEPVVVPEGVRFAKISFQLVTNAANATPQVWIDDVECVDSDTDGAGLQPRQIPLGNSGFEISEGEKPKNWTTIGASTAAWVTTPVHGGTHAVAVTDSAAGAFSGWSTTVPIRADAAYTVAGWIKAGKLSPNGAVTGGALSLQFLDRDGQLVGPEEFSPSVNAGADWTQTQSLPVLAPPGATALRITAGLQYCTGTAWFDDLTLTETRVSGQHMALLRRPDPKPSAGLQFAKNLLVNGDIETLENGKPKGWTYIGKSKKDWTPEEIATFHREGRPVFSVGRGKGEVSDAVVYSGAHALLNISIDPPMSPNAGQWYGRSPVDGYWLSDPMPCTEGKGYLASAWIRPGTPILQSWFGPLQIMFYGPKGNLVQGAPPAGTEAISSPRPGLGSIQGGVWSWWTTLPYTAPSGATTMRLRFGQELHGDRGGWGRTVADNLAVWEMPAEGSLAKVKDCQMQPSRFMEWFREAHAVTKPPYLPSPVLAPEYDNCVGRFINGAAGNLYRDPAVKSQMQVTLTNLIGESRKVSLQIERFDWLGNSDAQMSVPDIALTGYSDATATIELPPTNSYGAFYLEGRIMEGDATVGHIAGRYAVLPPLERPRSVENIWAVTVLTPTVHGDGRPFEKELGETLKIGGFGLAWVRCYSATGDGLEPQVREVDWYNSLGIRPILQINSADIHRPVVASDYESLGRKMATAFKGKVAAYSNWSIENSNHRTPDRPIYRPIIGKKMLTDEEYDLILSGIYDGIKSVDKKTPVLIGNIATDADANTIRRIYGPPANGRFDGAATNAYYAVQKVITNALKEFDAHGDTTKTIWHEEISDQRSPATGAARRRGEADGPMNMVRTHLSAKCLSGSRLKAFTVWEFASGADGNDQDSIVTDTLQPRPQFVAHAVMADATADATFVAEHSHDGVTIFEWKRGDGQMFTAWSNAGEHRVSVKVSKPALTVMDLMGNRSEVQAVDGKIALKVTSSPVYLFGGGNLEN